ncbi:hypothetical protein AAKU55_004741, partial [Oxalobacteraceae bacterium GrIS 1.11]
MDLPTSAHTSEDRDNDAIGWDAISRSLEPVHDFAELLDNSGMRNPYASDISREKFEEILP